ncbi:helix-turn-helix transcriptional regulator [Planosporangium thailandense]|uniref:Helix-turn-helix transcriptional regulator n=1 Tax=Planosporangium thailandense TaxID=765197 RepID=A0ABX0XT59_9ACTN|nr:helix-turn-helix transcriptional regulator [Planosporangium thailandense]
MTRNAAAGSAATDVFAALANPTRRELLRLLLEEGPQPVQRLASHFDMARPSVSEHLKVLRDAGLISEHRSGRERHYRLEAAPLRRVRDWLTPYERFWREKLANLRDLLDEEEPS